MLLSFSFCAMSSNRVSLKEATLAATNFYFEKYCTADGKSISYNDIQISGVFEEKVQEETVLYIFNFQKGFVVMPTIQSLPPVLAYSFEGNYSSTNLPPAFKDFINYYSEATVYNINKDKSGSGIRSIRGDDVVDYIEPNPLWSYLLDTPDNFIAKVKNNKDLKSKGVTPLLQSTWGQAGGYNDLCPVFNSSHCVTGCVATAMAQLMYYHKFPEHGKGSHSYYHPYFENISADFSDATYEWDKMKNTYADSYDETAELMFHCGVSVDMFYKQDESSASMFAVKTAMVNYFNYSIRAEFVMRDTAKEEEWCSMLKEQLDDGKPVLYDGYGSMGAHAFVCDGYDDQNRFHFNWGWDGSLNGYFNLNDLTPDIYDFTDGQSAIIDLVPYDFPYCVADKTYTDSTKTFDDGSGYSKYWNNTDCQWLIAPDSGEKITITFNSFQTEEGKDILTIYDGESTSDPVLGTFSGSSIPGVITSTGNKVLLNFITDSINQYFGWEITYNAVSTGINEKGHTAGPEVSVFPNPARGILNISTGLTGNTGINIFNMIGEKVYTKTTACPEKQTIDVSAFPKGVYFINLRNETYNITRKIIFE